MVSMMLTGTRRRLSSWAVAVGLGLMVAACGNSTSTSNSSTIKIGILTTCGGPFAAFEQESFSGAKYALIQSAGGKSQGASPQNGVSGASVSGHPIEISFGCSDATPDKALAEARRLIQNVGVDILLGPLSGDEGIAIANYAKQQPNKTFVNGTSGAQQTTLSVKAPNFFRFGGDGAQWMAGLGTYAYQTLHWRNVAILGEDYSYPWTQAAGFIGEFCPAGGKVAKRIWIPLGTTDWASAVAQLPGGIDGFLLLTGGTDTVAVEKEYATRGGNLATHMLGGSSVMDPTSFTVGKPLDGLAGGSPVPLGSTDSAWTSYVNGLEGAYPATPKGSLAGSLFTGLYYDGMTAIIQGLKQVGADLSGNQSKFQQALSGLTLSSPNGSIKLDSNRNAILPNYIVEIVSQSDGSLGFKTIKTVPNVNQTFNGFFGPSSSPSRDSPSC
ncbi:MAG: ABC transporter substrate-binding protein [Chloroflexi bacterium]|nr:MAG: ABC transporter substrate-binding protein [Chloroflexota bacterium]TMD64382.1 MAG: ABC transporter substrate-binding protein [Chloroflexota bacterium]